MLNCLCRATGYNLGSINIPKGPQRNVSVTITGQLDSCSIYQQHGAQCPLTGGSVQGPVDVGFIKINNSDYRVHTRDSECCGRC